MKEETVSIMISFYAAIIATISLLWNIINTIIEKISKVTVEVNFFDNMIPVNDEFIIAGIMQINVINKSKRKKYIKAPCIKLSYEHGISLDGFDGTVINLVNFNDKRIYPIEIEPEAELTFKYPISVGSEWMFEKAKENDTFKAIVVDTTGKKYKSKKCSIKKLVGCFNKNKHVPSNILNLLGQ